MLIDARPNRLPKADDLLAPTVHALKQLGGSASVDELGSKLLEILDLPDEVVAYRREGASMDEVLYRAAWARTYLKLAGFVERTSRGVWALTAKGRELPEEELKSLSGLRKPARAKSKLAQERSEASAEAELPEEQSWKSELLAILRAMSADGFERLSRLILLESGFTKVAVTGKTGDGGIDGVGVLRVQLISFQVLFQCKRYREVVGAPAIRDFRGAMVGRTDKGLFITTGRFTPDARKEATRDGAPPIELIDGEEFCELLKQLRIGVGIEIVERVIIQKSVFDSV